MPRSTFAEVLKNASYARLALAEAIRNGDEAEMTRASNEAKTQDAGLAKIMGRLPADDPSTDMALIFSEFTPEGEILPLSWVAALERHATEPMTVVRVSRDAASDVREALK